MDKAKLTGTKMMLFCSLTITRYQEIDLKETETKFSLYKTKGQYSTPQRTSVRFNEECGISSKARMTRAQKYDRRIRKFKKLVTDNASDKR